MQVTGLNGTTFNSKWADGVKTLHAVQTNGLPNFFLLGLAQAGGSPNQLATVDELAKHVAFIISTASSAHGSRALVIQPTTQAEDAYTAQIVKGAHTYATMGICPPSYFNGEGDLFELARQGGEEVTKRLQMGSGWSKGLNNWKSMLEEWRRGEPLRDFEVRVVGTESKL
jgi:hypothetical protein